MVVARTIEGWYGAHNTSFRGTPGAQDRHVGTYAQEKHAGTYMLAG